MEALKIKNYPVIARFFIWYFFETPKTILLIWRNFLFGVWRWFSIGLLLKTFFSPWRRDVTTKPKGFDISLWFQTLLFNTMARVFGAGIRFWVIMLGLVSLCLVLIVGFFALILWYLWLPISAWLIFWGLKLAIT